MFKTRLISGIALVAAMILVLYPGGAIPFAAFGMVALIGVHEFYAAVGLGGPLRAIGLSLTGLWFLSEYFRPDLAAAFLALALIAVLAPYVFLFPRIKTEDAALCYFGFVYAGVLLSAIPLTRSQLGGAYVFLIFFSAWGADTCAYAVGMLIGKHKMAPVLSPKKSIEGAVGGVAGAVLLGIIFAKITGEALLPFAAACFFGALLSMVGDLAASAIKRTHEIKDFGWCIPGHGGVLDRFDSLLFTGPAVYFIGLLLAGSGIL